MKNKNRPINILATAFMLTSIMVLGSTSLADTDPSLNKLLTKIAAEANKELPITKATAIIKNIEVVDNQYIINSSLVQVSSEKAKEALAQKTEAVTQTTIDNMCNSESYRMLLDKGAVIVYNYQGNDNKFAYQITVTQQNCLPTEPEPPETASVDTPLQIELKTLAKEINKAMQTQPENQKVAREVTIEFDTYIDKFLFKTMTTAQVKKLILQNQGQLPIGNKNSYCSLQSIQKLLNDGASFVFEYYGNDNQLAYKATLHKNWCSYSDEEKLATQKLENQNQVNL